MSALRHLLPAATALVSAMTCGRAPAAPGDFDLSFNGTGWLTPSFGEPAPQYVQAQDMAVQSDGKIVVVGNVRGFSSEEEFFAARFHPNGGFDTSFNGTGFTVTHLPGRDWPTTMALQSDGKIIVAGLANSWSPVLVRYNTDGTLDSSFGTEGTLILSGLSTNHHKMALQSDGQILSVTGNVVFRHSSSGTRDLTFGTSGQGRIQTLSSAAAIAAVPGAKVLLAAGQDLFQLGSNGFPDMCFGGTGKVSLPITAYSLALQDDGKILVAGYAQSSDLNFAVVRLFPGGGFDTSFSGTGTAVYDFDVNRTDVASKVLTQSDGKIILTGRSRTNGRDDLAAVRLSPNGSRDTTFGPGGRVLTNFGDESASCPTAALQTDGKLLMAGELSIGSSSNALLARYTAMEGPIIGLEAPAGTLQVSRTNLPVDFGIVPLGARVREFTVRNHGTAPLSLTSVALGAQSHPGQFQAGPPATAIVAPGAQTTFAVAFTPTGTGPRTSTLSIASNATNLPSFLIPLTGRLATPLETWRYTWFGSPDNSGPGADTNDFDGDGLPNFMEYATRSHPHQDSPFPCQPAAPGQFTYTRPAAALTEFSWQPESALSLEGPWSSQGLTTTILSDDGAVQTIQVTSHCESAPRLFLRLHITKL